MSTRGADGGSARPFRRGPRHRARHKRRAARSRWRRPVLLASGLVIIALAAVGAWVAQVHAQRDTVLGGVTVAGHEVGGMSRDQVVDLLSDKALAVTLTVVSEGHTTSVSLAEAGGVIDAAATADAAMAGSGTWRGSALSLVRGRSVPVRTAVDRDAVEELGRRIDSQTGGAPVDASMRLTEDGSAFEAVAGAPGRGVDRGALAGALETAATSLSDQTIDLPAVDMDPAVSLADAEAAAEAANRLIAPQVALSADKTTASAEVSVRASWVKSSAAAGRLEPGLSRERVAAWVDGVAASAERAPINGIDNVDDAGTVLEPARPPKPGRIVTDRDAATSAIVEALEAGTAYSGSLTVEEDPASTEQRVVPAGPERFAYQAAPGEKWVDVNLTDSTLTAYEGTTQVHGPILINHGGVGHETITGTYKIYLRYQAQDMGCTPEWPYCEKDVPWIAYWHKDYALHGAPWASEFGIGTDESSHGCVNIPVEDAHWIYDWIDVGTTVVTHY